MSGDQAKWVLCRALSNFSFVTHLWKHSKSFVLLKTPSESNLYFQRYKQFCPAENNKIQTEFHTIIGYISKSIFSTYDSYRLITSHILFVQNSVTQNLKRLKFWTQAFYTHIHLLMTYKTGASVTVYCFQDVSAALPYQIKTQYLQIESKVDTSIKQLISGLSTTGVKRCMYNMFVIDTVFRYERALQLIVC